MNVHFVHMDKTVLFAVCSFCAEMMFHERIHQQDAKFERSDPSAKERTI